MSIDDVATLATPLAWPITALLIVTIFHAPVSMLLKRLAETLTFKSVKVKALGVEAELSPEYARTVLHELLDDITATSNQLTPEEVLLFDAILTADEAKTVAELVPGFARDSQEHVRLRNLRDQKLILPKERGQWKSDKHPAVTPYGRLVAKLRTTGSDRVIKFRDNDG